MSRLYITLDTWLTSDQHWSHGNIRRYQNRPDDHFEIMRERWNERVAPDDFVLHLGDLVCFGDRERHPDYLRDLNGRKYLLRGNHDDHTRDWYLEAGFEPIGRKPFNWHPDGDTIIRFSHEPEYDTDFWSINVHGHIHANPYWHGTPRIEDRRNVSVEVTDYAPVRLRDVLANPNPTITFERR